MESDTGIIGDQPVLNFHDLRDNVVEGTLRLQKGDTLNISCYGNEQLEWIIIQGAMEYVRISGETVY